MRAHAASGAEPHPLVAALYGRAVAIDRSRIRVKAMLIAPNTTGTAHAV